MSLKAFHFLFITLATLVALMLGVWCVTSIQGPSRLLPTLLGGLAFVAAGGLVAYEVWFARKLKREKML